eukprot:gnl/MRDRNA2_/MRDRNA2_103120_c0_seq1.p1 gnl/MRDRNA2_/MRDRNA2_103120_c0~~gnl/MRDRNA2_/MRDRNA2_103120_c0_seq1.p1  ORF type:complete len:1001 (-),score=242.34 gnl/MRDRNA2_/MRDRNA2_103120_c0_seq1:243-3245(-)
MERACQDCNAVFVQRAGYETRCFQCYMSFRRGSAPSAAPAAPSLVPPAEGDGGDTVFSIGKHRGKTFCEVFESEKGYVTWAEKLDDPSPQILEFRSYAALRNGARTRSRTPPRRLSSASTGSSRVQADSPAGQNPNSANNAENIRRASLSSAASEGSPAPNAAPSEGELLGSGIASSVRQASEAQADAGDAVFSIGKHRGKTFRDVFSQENGPKGYVAWVMKLENPSYELAEFKKYAALRKGIPIHSDMPSRNSATAQVTAAAVTGLTAGQSTMVAGDSSATATATASANVTSAASATSQPPQVPDAGNQVWTIGKHKGKTFHDVFTCDKSYVDWAQKKVDPSGELASFVEYIKQRDPRRRSRTPPRRASNVSAPVLIGECDGDSDDASSAGASPAPAATAFSHQWGSTAADASSAETGNTEFIFGKHKGRTFLHVYKREKEYVEWVQKLDNTSGQMAKFQDFIFAQLQQEREAVKKRQAEEQQRWEAGREEREKRAAEEKKRWEALFEEMKKRRAAEQDRLKAEREAREQQQAEAERRAAERKRKAEEEKRAEERRKAAEKEKKRSAAGAEFLVYLRSKFDEYRDGYPTLRRFEQLRTGHDPFGRYIKEHGDDWMRVPNHRYYRLQDNWDPKKILEWGVTYHDKYLPSAEPEAIPGQKAAIELMLRQCCLMVKPNVKRQIYWKLHNTYKTFSRNIERVFGKIFEELEELSANRVVAHGVPPSNVDTSSPENFFDASFTWSWQWPVATRVAIACKYYMWKRSEMKDLGKEESIDASDRRILFIQMLLEFKQARDIEEFPNGDGSDVLYKRPGGTTAILVEAPDDGAVHVFQRLDNNITDAEHRDRIFAIFRQFNSLVTRKIHIDSTQVYAKVGDTAELPEAFVMDEMSANKDQLLNDTDKKRMMKNKDVLDAHPEMKEVLTKMPKKDRPSLQEFLGWSMIITHRKQLLTKTAFVDELGIPEKRAKAVERKVINDIKSARKKAGEASGEAGEVDFHGGSWY